MSAPTGRLAADPAAVDAQNPWPGLASFSEEQEPFFHGRSSEVNDLLRRVRRKPLTVLYGQSGLGKTSLVHAGLFPRLRAEGFLPVPIRVDYGAGTAEPAAQIRLALADAFAAADIDPGAALAEGETLWECLHRFGMTFRNRRGDPMVPVLVFDQFEELFTLGPAQADGGGFTRRLVDELGALIENRVPRSLEARLEESPELVEAFDFERQDYRVLLSLREDYLAHLHDLRQAIPSIALNSMRLARMNGEQALEAVLKPGGALVTPPVAEAIVRFVAGARETEQGRRTSSSGVEFRSLEVEPALLSLFCRELNQKRRGRGLSEITLDLVQGSREAILQEFYEGCFRDQPPAVRAFVEEELLTDDGHRESVAWARAERALGQRGASPQALDGLVRRRLLHVEERLRVRRVELAHDVLALVARQSRVGRRQAEALAEAERREAEARDRLRVARRRGLMIVSASLVVGGTMAVLGAVALRQGRVATQARVKADSASQAAIAAESVAVRRAIEVGTLNRQLVDSAAALAGQRDELRQRERALRRALDEQARLRDDADRNATRAEAMASVASGNLQRMCDYSLELADTLSDLLSPLRFESRATSAGPPEEQAALEGYEAYIATTEQHFDSMFAKDPSATCVQQMRARIKVSSAGEAQERRRGARVLRDRSRNALPAVQLLRRSDSASSWYLAQILYTDLAYYFWLVDDTANAETAATEGMEVSRKLDAGRNRNALFRYARLHQMLGNALWDRRRGADARRQFLRGLTITDSGLARGDQNPSSLLLAQSQLHLRVAMIDSAAGRRDSARARHAAAVESARRRSAERTSSALDWLASTLEWQADLEAGFGNAAAARAAYAESRAARADTTFRGANRLRALGAEQQVVRKAARSELSIGDTTRAVRLLRDRLALDSAVIELRGPDQASLDSLGFTLDLLGRVYRARGEFGESIRARAALVAARRQALRLGDSRGGRSDLATALGNLAFSQLFGGEADRAVNNALEGLRVDSTQTYILTNLAHGYLLSGRPAPAESVYRANAARRLDSETTFAEAVVDDVKALQRWNAMTAEQAGRVCLWLGRPEADCRGGGSR